MGEGMCDPVCSRWLINILSRKSRPQSRHCSCPLSLPFKIADGHGARRGANAANRRYAAVRDENCDVEIACTSTPSQGLSRLGILRCTQTLAAEPTHFVYLYSIPEWIAHKKSGPGGRST